MAKCKKNNGCQKYNDGKCLNLCGQPNEVFQLALGLERNVLPAPSSGVMRPKVPKQNPIERYRQQVAKSSLRQRRDYFPAESAANA